MPIKLKNKIFHVQNPFMMAFQQISATDLPGVIVLKINKIGKAINAELKSVQETMKALDDRYQPDRILPEDSTDEDKAKLLLDQEAHHKELTAIGDEEFEIDFDKVHLPITAWSKDPVMKDILFKNSTLAALEDILEVD